MSSWQSEEEAMCRLADVVRDGIRRGTPFQFAPLEDSVP